MRIVVGVALFEATVGFFTAVALMLFLARLEIFSDGILASTYEFVTGPAGRVLLIGAGTPLIAALCCWLQMHWDSITRRTWVTVIALLAVAAILHMVLVERGSGVYKLSQPPQGAWFAWPGEIFGEEPTASMIWFAPRFGGVEYGNSICLVLGIVVPGIAVVAALYSLLTGRIRSLSTEGETSST